MSLLVLVDRHLRHTGMSASAFGRAAVGDPRFVQDLRRGREPRPPLERRVRAFLQAPEAGR